ncbi:hypothetical protein D0Z00_001611 [Geotrichum galactomycetum]|uniref:Uncharacterized protein n=1 Tax=Geotrichum galactomycetum TaxID=27317 RepID=A0ACB6V6M6_9ASCO|nr:hypothetical protein D0Z00_001611 [Geotrichum candidum]
MPAAAAASAMANNNSENVHNSANTGSNGSTSNINSYHLHQHHFYTNPHNRSDLTLHKVSAIQTALDDNKSPTFAESFESKLLSAATAAARDSDPTFSLVATSNTSEVEDPFILTTNGGASSSGNSAELDYALLGRYGWAVLVLTWTIVLAGITSMLGLWDVPRASMPSIKAYEKATGYPIQGYYSCLVFMVFIASWVWCTTSWVGMKFFRHTKGGLTKSREASTVAT